jgi:hypothetical protein
MRKIFASLLISAAIVWPGSAAALRGMSDLRARPAGAPRYDIAREAAVEGTVMSVVTNPAPGLPAGAHLLLRTSSGTVDAHLGSYAMSGPGAVSVTPGQAVKAVGVMTNIRGRRVLIVRTLQAGLGFYRIRNEHGFLIRHASTGWMGRAKTWGGGRP